MNYAFQDFPKWMYGPNGASCIVQNQEGEDALSDEWSPTPLTPIKGDPAASGAQDPVAEKAAEESKSPWLARAAETGLEVDRRWSVVTLKAKVLEAEAAKRA